MSKANPANPPAREASPKVDRVAPPKGDRHHLALYRQRAGQGAAAFAALNLLFAAWYPMAGLGRSAATTCSSPGGCASPLARPPPGLQPQPVQRGRHVQLPRAELGQAGGWFRVLVIGDFSVWGTLLRPDETFPACWMPPACRVRQDRPLLQPGLPHPLGHQGPDDLEEAMRYQPDLIMWLVTLEPWRANAAPRRRCSPITPPAPAT